jgi:hypothetical protein
MRWPDLAPARANICSLIRPTSGNDAASAYESVAGLSATSFSGSAICSAKVPMVSRDART